MLRRVLNALRPWPKHPIDGLYGIETSQKVLRLQLNTGDKAADDANNGYAGSQPSIVRAAIAALPPLEPGAAFIDLGCGKGRVLAIATEFGFASVEGIELSPPLCRTAARNARRVGARHPDRTVIKVVCGDATTPVIPAAGDVVLFLYNSFRAPLVAKLIEHLEVMIGQKAAGRVFVIYYNPTNAALFDARASFSRYYAARLDFAADEPMSFSNDFDSVVIWQVSVGEIALAMEGADRWVEVRIPDRAAVVRHDVRSAAEAAGEI